MAFPHPLLPFGAPAEPGPSADNQKVTIVPSLRRERSRLVSFRVEEFAVSMTPFLRLTLVAATLVPSVALARADTKSVLDARGATLLRWLPKSGTSGIGRGGSARQEKQTTSKGLTSTLNQLTR